MLMRWRGGAAVLWSVQGDAAARVEDGGGGRRRRSSCRSARRKEEEEMRRKEGGMRGEPEALFISLEGQTTCAKIEETKMDK